MVTVLKLGGSVITDKERPETVDVAALESAARIIGTALEDTDQLVIVHGGGSFGHHHAAAHGVSSTAGTADAPALLEIHRAMGELQDAVIDHLHARAVPALPVRPLSVASRRSDGSIEFPTTQLETMLSQDFVPVVNGDVVVDGAQGGTILGGDQIVVTLSRALGARRVGLCSTVPGVLDDGTVVPEIEDFTEVSSVVGESEATDVTGGMAEKIRQLLELDIPASVFDLDALETFLESGSAGTVVR